MDAIAIIKKHYPNLNDPQLEAISSTEGPLLIIAGPGSGKTLVLVIRGLHILLRGLAEPKELLICTFTEKAAFELRDRISASAKKIGYSGDLSEFKAGTIHGICNDYLMKYRHHTQLSSNYEVLDELTQPLFIFENFDEVIGPEIDGKYLGKWTTRWTAIEGSKDFFNKITEELIDPQILLGSEDPLLQNIGQAYLAYEAKLIEKNSIDFAHQQKLFYQLLQNPDAGPAICDNTKYIMVDEYQDTNFIQEQILLRLSRPQNNLCVVGDEDQSLYRFRGATVRNILEFQKNFESCKSVKLTLNYRSHKDIIGRYNRFMEACNWDNPGSSYKFRYQKSISPDPSGFYPKYPAVFSIWGQNFKDEADRLADMVLFLKNHHIIEDYSQVALLLHSVRLEYSGTYVSALEAKGIPAFYPRARGYFENEEVKYIVACFAVLLGYYGDGRGDIDGRVIRNLTRYVDESMRLLAKDFSDPHPLAKAIQKFHSEIQFLKEEETLDMRLADYFYHFLSHEPFRSMLKDENRARNLAIFSQLLNIFQNYYRYTIITYKNREWIRRHFFNSFLRFLFMGGINEYEDPDSPFPKGHVQIMTIHQSKGLEFPVVIAGSLDKNISSTKILDRYLGSFYHRGLFEPMERITEFDRMRLHYVAFSRAEKILALTSTKEPKLHFFPIWQGLPQWPYVRKNLLKSLSFRLKKRMGIKKSFSFTNHLKVYETCPRQYQYFREYDFVPSRSAEIFFGSLVHQTIEDIHRWVLDGKSDVLNRGKIRGMFNLNFRTLLNAGIRPIGEVQRETAFHQIMNYFNQNQDYMRRIIDTEVDVSVEKEDYILTGKIDLLLGEDNKVELLDFKSQPKPEADDVRLDAYYKQLCLYAHILEARYGKQPERLHLYWTGEEKRERALMTFHYFPERVEEAGAYFDRVVAQILNKDFSIKKIPEKKVCKECDFRTYCAREGTIKTRYLDEGVRMYV